MHRRAPAAAPGVATTDAQRPQDIQDCVGSSRVTKFDLLVEFGGATTRPPRRPPCRPARPRRPLRPRAPSSRAPTPPRLREARNEHEARDRYILIVLVIVGALAALWLMALSPKREESAQLDKDIAAAQQQLDQSKQEKVTFAQAQLSFPRMYASLGRLGKAVPPDEDVPSLLVQTEPRCGAGQRRLPVRRAEARRGRAARRLHAARAGSGCRRGHDRRGGSRPAPPARPAPTGARSAAARPSPRPSSRRFPSNTSSRAASTTSRS